MLSKKLNKNNILKIISGSKSSLNYKTLEKILSIRRKEKKLLKDIIRELRSEGKIIKLRSRRYTVPDTKDYKTIDGTITFSKYGYAFLIPEDTDEKDVYINAGHLSGAFHKDKVRVRILDDGPRWGSREGMVTAIIDRGIKKIVGRYNKRKNKEYLIPIDENIPLQINLPKSGSHSKFKTGDICAALIQWETYRKGFINGEIIQNFKNLDNPEDDIMYVIAKNNLATDFSPKSKKDASGITPGKIDSYDRVDLRNLDFITIDPVDAKDFDDAIYLEKNNQGWIIYVAIADVASHVMNRSSMDKEAFKRANSFYFPGFVIPMLPFEISNGYCSLNPEEDKYTLTVKIHISRQMSLGKVEILNTVINSVLRTDYDKVLRLFESNYENTDFSLSVSTMLKNMYELATKLYEQRMRNGGIDFDLPEPAYIYDKQGRIVDIKRKSRTSSTRVVEEFMLLANKCVSEYINSRGRPQIYRVHEEPDPERLKDFYEKARLFGYTRISRQIKSTHDLNEFIKNIKDEERARSLRYLLLRSMKQAKYTTNNTGHYGLGFDSYAHFTSPIRRYPDLTTHRIIKEIIKSGKNKKKSSVYEEAELEKIANHSSARERLADQCERDILKIKSARFMEDKVGRIFTGYISGEVKSGFFIELKDHFVEGFCTKENISQKGMPKKRFKGKKRQEFRYSIGDQVKVKLERVVLEELLIDFSIVR